MKIGMKSEEIEKSHDIHYSYGYLLLILADLWNMFVGGLSLGLPSLAGGSLPWSIHGSSF